MRVFSAFVAVMCCTAAAAWATDDVSPRPTANLTETTTADETENPKATENKTKQVQFDGNTLELAFEDTGDDGDTIVEFIPQGETLEKWTKLAAIRQQHQIDDPKAAVDAVAQRLNEHNPPLPNDVRTDDENGTATIDFIIWPGDAATPDNAEYVEYNIFKYSKGEAGGLISQQYAIRAYEDIPGFLSKLSPLKDRLLDEMAKKGLTTDEDDDDSEQSPND